MKLLNQGNPRYALDYSRTVHVYRNLHKDCWSIKQGGLVKAHTDEVLLNEPKFVVLSKGRQKVIKQRRKIVHAWLSGIMHENPFSVHEGETKTWHMITYDPYKYKSFVAKADLQPITKAKQAWMVCSNVWAREIK